jgi:beta-galactosidase
MPCIDEYGFGSRLIEWIESGGIWIAGPLTDIRNIHGAKYIENPTGHIEKLTGAYIKYALPALTNPAPADVEWSISESYSVTEKAQLWADGYETPDSCQRFGVYSEEPLKGLAAAFFAPVGSSGGGIIVLGTNPSDKTLIELISFAFARKNLKKGIETSPNAVAVERVDKTGADAGLIILETGFTDGCAVLPHPMKNIVSGETLCDHVNIGPYTVLFLEYLK